MNRFAGVFAVALSLVLASGVASAQLTKEQGKCVNKINKDMIKLAAQRGKENNECVEDYVKGALAPATAENCLTLDPNGKLASRAAKTTADEQKNDCLGANLPPYSYTSAANTNAEALAGETGVIRDVFGPNLDASLKLCNPNEQACECQRFAVDRIEKIYRAAGKVFTKCKKAALAVGKDPFTAGAASAVEVAQCMTSPALSGFSVQEDTKGKIANARTQLFDTLTQFCTGLPMTSGDAFSTGKCSGNTGLGVDNITALTDCLKNNVMCRFCKMVEDADGLVIDCDTWSGGTCEAMP